MPSQKRRRFEIRQRHKRREKRRKAIRLNQKELEILKKQKKGPVYNFKDYNFRNLKNVNNIHDTDFFETVRTLSKRFPGQTIELLDEGAGESTFGKELEEQADKIRQGLVKVTRTDIRKLDPEMVVASPEELLRVFGYNRFHLIVSSFGGTVYSKVRLSVALSNIIGCLKPGGMASICITPQKLPPRYGEFFGKIQRLHPYASIKYDYGGIIIMRKRMTIRKS